MYSVLVYTYNKTHVYHIYVPNIILLMHITLNNLYVTVILIAQNCNIILCILKFIHLCTSYILVKCMNHYVILKTAIFEATSVNIFFFVCNSNTIIINNLNIRGNSVY